MKELERNMLVYIPTGETYIGGLVHINKVENGLIYTMFGKFSWEELEPFQEELENKFGATFAINW